jgi:hypothetical protein
MTPNTDSSKEIEIPQEFQKEAIDAAVKYDFTADRFLTSKGMGFVAGAEWAYSHLSSLQPGGWISVKDRTPDTVEGKDYSENVFVICDGKLEVMSYGWVDAEPEGGWVWSNCYGDIRGDSEWDDEYKPTHWMPLPKLPTTSGDKGMNL